GHCSAPVRLHGSSETWDTTTGESLGRFSSDDQPLGVLHVPCGNRRADVCPACSRLYARDTFEVIRTGAVGGKTVPASVASAPLVFVTLTAPSFGHVHSARKDGGRCRPGRPSLCGHGKPTRCAAVHGPDDPTAGAPLCADCYDHTSAVVWQWWAPELWRRFTIRLRRDLAANLGVPASRLGDVASVQFAKVAEYQNRGLVHFHALVRLDGPAGPGSAAPINGHDLSTLVEHAAQAVRFDAPPVDRWDTARTLRFGSQIDTRTVRAGAVAGSDDLTAEAVAGYLAKYSTKSATAGPGGRAHLGRMVRTCRALAWRAAHACRTHQWQPEDQTGCTCGTCSDGPYWLLGKWARTLGFRGHFSTRSRRYSVTLGALRRARRRFQHLRATDPARLDTADLEARLLADDQETTLVVGHWTFIAAGWDNPGDKALADAAAARAREYAQWKADQTRQP
ncbi:MAG: hypothetical protein FWH11_03775, partial [Micrococcales bacterium]|nr:hypothetical protein [Micrococcales bacterium]